MAISSQILFHKNGEITLDKTDATDFKAGAALGQTSAGYSRFKAGQAGKSYVGPSLNDRKDSWGVDAIPTVCETPAILELVEDTAGDLFAAVTFAINDSVYVDANGFYTNVATGNVLVGKVRNVSPMVIKFTV